MTNTICEFSNPQNLGDEQLSDWEYKNFNCSSTNDIFALIQNSETGAEFYIQKTLNYGDTIIIWFLTIFSFYLIFKITYNFFWKK